MRSRTKQKCVASLLVLVSLALVGLAKYRLIRSEGHVIRNQRIRAAQDDHRSTKQREVTNLVGRLKEANVSFHINKGNPYTWPDLSDTDGSESLLQDVHQLVELSAEAYPWSDNSFHVTLGPGFDDSALPYLMDIPALEYLDVSRAAFSEEGRDRLRARPSGCEIDTVGLFSREVDSSSPRSEKR